MSNLIESFEIKLSFSTLFIKIVNCGNDCSVSFFGGDKAHIGCAVLAIPQESLLENGEVSCTISTLNVTGHKDDEIARLIAKKICTARNCIVSCSGGFHKDKITKEEILELMEAVSKWELPVL